MMLLWHHRHPAGGDRGDRRRPADCAVSFSVGALEHSPQPPVQRPQNVKESTHGRTTLDTLFHETLKDIYYAERKIGTAQRKMARAAQDPELKAPSRPTNRRRRPSTSACPRCSMPWASARPARPATRSRGSSPRHRRSWRSSRAPRAGCGPAGRGPGRRALRDRRYGTLKAWAAQLGLGMPSACWTRPCRRDGHRRDPDRSGRDRHINAAAQADPTQPARIARRRSPKTGEIHVLYGNKLNIPSASMPRTRCSPAPCSRPSAASRERSAWRCSISFRPAARAATPGSATC